VRTVLAGSGVASTRSRPPSSGRTGLGRDPARRRRRGRAARDDRRRSALRRPEGGRVVGLAGWKAGRLRHVYVDPDHFRRGIGSRLLDRVQDEFRRRTHHEELRAGVALHAEDFYVANGYEITGRATAWDGSEYFETYKKL
jgi:GNAT superfamily N-acetyltransferase